MRTFHRPPAVFRTAAPALRHRNFRLFLGGQFISNIGTWMQTVAHGWLVFTLTGSAFLVGLVPALGGLPILLFTLYGGVLADRVNKRRFILWLQGLMLLEAVTLAVLTATGQVTVAWVIVLAIAFGFLTAFEVPARQAFVVDLVGKRDLMNAIALNSAVFNLSRVLGPAISGVLITAAGVAAAFFANAASYVAVLIGLIKIRLPEEEVPATAGMQTTLAEGLAHVRGDPEPRALIILTAVTTIFGYPFIAMLPVFAGAAVGVGAAGYGALVSAVGVGAAAGALATAAVGGKKQQALLAMDAAGLFALALAGAALVPGLLPAGALLTAAGCAMAIQSIAANTHLQRTAPDHLRGRVMGLYSFVALGLAPFGTLQAGWIAEHFGVRATFLLGGFVVAATAWWLGRGVRARRALVITSEIAGTGEVPGRA